MRYKRPPRWRRPPLPRLPRLSPPPPSPPPTVIPLPSAFPGLELCGDCPCEGYRPCGDGVDSCYRLSERCDGVVHCGATGADEAGCDVTPPDVVLPPTVVGFLLLWLLGKNSPVGQLLDALGVTVIFTWGATAIAATIVAPTSVAAITIL